MERLREALGAHKDRTGESLNALSLRRGEKRNYAGEIRRSTKVPSVENFYNLLEGLDREARIYVMYGDRPPSGALEVLDRYGSLPDQYQRIARTVLDSLEQEAAGSNEGRKEPEESLEEPYGHDQVTRDTHQET